MRGAAPISGQPNPEDLHVCSHLARTATTPAGVEQVTVMKCGKLQARGTIPYDSTKFKKTTLHYPPFAKTRLTALFDIFLQISVIFQEVLP